jgi:peptidoglycan/xylan/chitin deacetylase (PgdA/CDA1 family)
MSANSHIRSSAAAASLLAAALLAAHVRPAAAQQQQSTCGGARTMLAATTPSALHSVQTLGHSHSTGSSYGWPVKPFDRQHPVRAFLNDPRIGRNGVISFHFGIDVAAPDGTPVYAVEGGTVFFDSTEAIAVKVGPRHEFGYWHIDPAVKPHQVVRRHELLGHVGRGWGHVHFAERVGNRYLNPLRPGGLGPYSDPVAPDVAELSLVHVRTGVEILANVYDTTWPPVPGLWTNEPVAPALIQWRVTRNGQPRGAWRTAVDFRDHMLDRRVFHSIYAPPTAQNHKGKAGLYCFYVAHAWKPADGSYRLEVAATDTRANRTVAGLDVTVTDGQVRRMASSRSIARTARTIALPILMYHRIDLLKPSLPAMTRRLTVDPTDFAAQMEWLKRAGFHAVTQRQALEALELGRPLPSKPIMITFDDGYRDVLDYASPVLERLHMPATSYVITGRISGPDPSFLTWRNLRLLEQRGVAIGSHTVTHADLPRLTDTQALAELRDSRVALERRLGHPVPWLAYPYGKEDARVVALARRAGYVLAVTTQPGAIQNAADPLELHRYEVLDTTGVAGLASLLGSDASAGSGR